MKPFIFLFSIIFSMFTEAGELITDFENNSVKKENLYTWNSKAKVKLFSNKSNNHVLCQESQENWNTVRLQLEKTPAAEYVSSLEFDFYPIPSEKKSNNIGIKVFDNNLYQFQGITVWTAQQFPPEKWSRCRFLKTQLPADFNFKGITRLSFINYWPGKYYYDNLCFSDQPLIYQNYENIKTKGKNFDESVTWLWDSLNERTMEETGDNHYVKLVLKKEWDGIGIGSSEIHFSEEKRKNLRWYNNFNREKNNCLSFRIKAFPDKPINSALQIMLHDRQKYSGDQTNANMWTRSSYKPGEWSYLYVYLSDFPDDYNFSEIDKIQILFPHAGTFLLDDIIIEKQPVNYSLQTENTALYLLSNNLLLPPYKIIRNKLEIFSGNQWKHVGYFSDKFHLTEELKGQSLRCRFELFINDTDPSAYKSGFFYITSPAD